MRSLTFRTSLSGKILFLRNLVAKLLKGRSSTKMEASLIVKWMRCLVGDGEWVMLNTDIHEKWSTSPTNGTERCSRLKVFYKILMQIPSCSTFFLDFPVMLRLFCSKFSCLHLSRDRAEILPSFGDMEATTTNKLIKFVTWQSSHPNPEEPELSLSFFRPQFQRIPS